MKDRNMLSSIEFYTLKRYGYYSSFNKQECGASLDYLSNVPSACILFRDENKALCLFLYILKKFVKKFIIIMTMIFSVSAFAASGFEFLFQLAGGAGAAIPNKEAKDLGFGTGLSFDADISAQIGYMFQVKEGFGISVLGELGYAWDFYLTGIDGGTLSSNTTGGVTTYTVEGKDGLSLRQYYHSFKLGLLPKFNIGFGGRHGLAIGIGGGVKIPISGNYTLNLDLNGTNPDGSALTQLDLKKGRYNLYV